MAPESVCGTTAAPGSPRPLGPHSQVRSGPIVCVRRCWSPQYADVVGENVCADPRAGPYGGTGPRSWSAKCCQDMAVIRAGRRYAAPHRTSVDEHPDTVSVAVAVRSLRWWKALTAAASPGRTSSPVMLRRCISRAPPGDRGQPWIRPSATNFDPEGPGLSDSMSRFHRRVGDSLRSQRCCRHRQTGCKAPSEPGIGHR